MRSFKGRDTEELFYDLGVFFLVAFVTKLLESFCEVMVVRDWMVLGKHFAEDGERIYYSM